MKDELTQSELDDIFYGAKPKVEAKFYLAEVLDIDASNEAGRRINKHMPYVHLVCKKEATEIRRPASKEDQRTFQREWHVFVKEQENNERPGQIPEDCAEVGPAYARLAAG